MKLHRSLGLRRLRRKFTGAALALVALLICTTSAFAQEGQDEGNPAVTGAPPPQGTGEAPTSHAGDLWQRDALTGNWGGLRTALEDRGVQLGLNYIGEAFGNPTGGIEQGTIYEGRLEMLVSLDLEKTLGWAGAAFHANAYQIQGGGLSGNQLNNFLLVSNIEAVRSTRLFDLWLEQQLFDGALSVRAGQLAADDEFFISLYGVNLLNSTFGWPGILTLNLPSGGPAYPLATPGVRVRATPTENLSLAVAVFNGDPAGPGPGDPQLRDPSGTSFRVNDGAFAIAEAAWAVNQGKASAGLPGTYKLGGWFHSGSFTDERFDTSGRSLADPVSSGIPATHNSDFGFYVIADQMVWREPGAVDQGLGVFLRLAGAPEDRNEISFYADGGVAYKGLLRGRDDDVFALGIAYAKVSSRASDLDRDARAFGAPNKPIRDFEAAIELTYRTQLAPWWSVQPDLQYIVHPGGNIANPNSRAASQAIPDALVIGLRTAILF